VTPSIQTGSAEIPAGDEKTGTTLAIDHEAIMDEVRIAQAVKTLGNMPAMLFGSAIAVGYILYLYWQASIASYAIYFLGLQLLFLSPMLSDYLRLRRQSRPERVSKRRIRILEIYSTTLGILWAVAIFLLMSRLEPTDGIIVLMLVVLLGFGVAVMVANMPKAIIGYVVPLYISGFVSVYVYDVLRLDALAILFVGSSISLIRTVWQNWDEAKYSVRQGLEKLEVEAEAHRRETEHMRSMIEAIPFPLVLTSETGAVELSAEASRQFGVNRRDIGDLNISDFLVDTASQEKITELQVKQGRLDEYEVQFRDVKGVPFWALLSSLPLKYDGADSWLNAIYVIDDRKRAEAELMQTHQTLEMVSRQLSKYISPQLYRSIFSGEQTGAIESKRRKLTVFFSDIASFTEITDQLESEELTSLLNQYLTEMAKIAHAHGAFFDKFIGDSMMFYFGDPETLGVKEDASACVRMAIAMQRRLQTLEIEWREQGLIDRPFKSRMGINTGYCTVGNFGSEDRMDYTIIGGEVNLAARMEANADAGGILIARETYSLVKDWLQAEEREPVTMKGFSKPIQTFSVLGIHDEADDDGAGQDAERQFIHHDEEGLTIAIDSDRVEKSDAILALKTALAQLEE
jgi:PAS domain S-box-containing protein